MKENNETKKITRIPLGLVLWHMDRLHDNRHWKYMPIKERARILSNLFVKYA